MKLPVIGNSGKKEENAAILPQGSKIFKFEIPASKKCPQLTLKRTRQMPAGEVKKEKGGFSWTFVRSRGIDGKAYAYQKYLITPSKISVEYALTEDTHEKLREIEAVSNLLNLLAVLKNYPVKWDALFRQLNVSLQECCDVVGASSESSLAKVHSLESTMKLKEAKFEEMLKTNERLESEISAISSEKQALKERVGELEGLDNPSLDEAIVSWVKVHGGDLEYKKFADEYKVSVARVSEGVDRLLKKGYLRRL